jgi:hypothetical protein
MPPLKGASTHLVRPDFDHVVSIGGICAAKRNVQAQLNPNSLFFPVTANFSLFGRQKFPVPMRREFRRNGPRLLVNSAPKLAEEPKKLQNPC